MKRLEELKQCAMKLAEELGLEINGVPTGVRLPVVGPAAEVMNWTVHFVHPATNEDIMAEGFHEYDMWQNAIKDLDEFKAKNAFAE